MASVVLRNFSAVRTLALTVALTATAGCAHQSEQAAAQQKQLQVLQARLDDAERTNGRLNVRIEELEDDVFLLQDRVDANRIALQRGGIMGQRAQASAQQKPSPSPQAYWSSSSSNSQSNPYVDQREMKRIPLGGGDERDWQVQSEAYREEAYREQVPTNTAPVASAAESDLVITEKEFEAFNRQHGDSPSPAPASSGSTGRKAQPNVTEERLATTTDLGDSQESKPKAAPPKRKDALGTYKDALAEYRGGNYQEALGGFEAFLASKPQPDYLDNALYWIGECHFGLGAYDDAVTYFQRVMKEQPDGNKVPDAMLKMSLAYDRVGRGDEATRLLEDLNRQYPATNAGRLASQKLAERK